VEDVLGILIIAHVGAMEDIDDLAVNSARDESQFSPQILAFLRGAFDREEFAILLAEHRQTSLGDIKRHITNLATLGFNTEFFR
jgi:hypothetical protein